MTNVLNAAPAATLQIVGDDLVFDRASGALRLPADPLRDKIEAVFTLAPAEGRPERRFRVTIAEALDAEDGIATDFTSAASLAEMQFLASAAPSWTYQDGFCRVVPTGNSRAHGGWGRAGGDGLYRALVRWSGAAFNYSLSRRFSFGARIGRTGDTGWTGVRVDAYMTATGAPKLQIREYTGGQGATVVLATADAPWAYDVWHWIEVQVSGASVKARIYPESAPAPVWQIDANVVTTGPGAFGPGGFPALDQSPAIDIRRIEFR